MSLRTTVRRAQADFSADGRTAAGIRASASASSAAWRGSNPGTGASVASAAAIEVGRHGVLLEKAGRRAVFLPQVAPEQGWNRDELLAQLCAKGGLPGDCWRSGARLSTFEAEVFREAGAR